jgi:GNAT superfamily N-acetyltransferase
MELEISPIGIEDLGQCLQLSDAEAGWNQNAADWKFILEAGAAFGIKRDNDLLASAAVAPYGQRFGWICMVLVRRSERRQGLASRLMQRCAAWLTERGSIAGLDATSAGREVYRQIGFRDVYTITRFHRPVFSPLSDAGLSANSAQLTADDIEAVAAYDRHHFGGDRSQLLWTWLQRVPRSAFQISDGGHIRGFVLAREGRSASHLGPAVADDQSSAIKLLATALNTIQGPVIIDVPDHHTRVQEWLLAQNFMRQRNFTRMLLGRTEPLDRPEQIIAVTGAEFG